jgi:hypothetical protein
VNGSYHTPNFKLGAYCLEPMGKLQVAVKVNSIYISEWTACKEGFRTLLKLVTQNQLTVRVITNSHSSLPARKASDLLVHMNTCRLRTVADGIIRELHDP